MVKVRHGAVVRCPLACPIRGPSPPLAAVLAAALCTKIVNFKPWPNPSKIQNNY